MKTPLLFLLLRVLACCTVVSLYFSLPAYAANSKAEAGLRRVFGTDITVTSHSAALSPEQAAAVKSTSGYSPALGVSYYTVKMNGKVIGYGIVDDVKGKSKPITYLLMVDASLNIKDIEVLAYREPYGGEVQYEAFRRQFRGKSGRDQLRVGSDIKNISGATISSNSVTNGVRRLLAVLRELKNSGKLA
ncbi:MAG: FMN-binding protein [Chlorobi bacterium CHB2]|nr:FMN-binding protein [Chlorobi bacterium CHB2]